MTNAKELRIPVGSFTVTPGQAFRLHDVDADADAQGLDKASAKDILRTIQKRLDRLQEILYAEGKHALLIVLQALDTGGKDGTIRKVFGPLNPQGVRVSNFKVPNGEELAHDYLWRIHQEVPRKGMIGVFNRSHYEDVLVPRVHKLVGEDVIHERYEQINAFEKYLSQNGVTILKFFLHISRDEQKKRLQRRLDNPDKHWKFNRGDLAERKLWDKYTAAINGALTACSTAWAPWYVIPANRKWYRDLAVGQAVLNCLEALDPHYPSAEPGLAKVVIE